MEVSTISWTIQQREGKWCVIKAGGENEGCHDSRAKALAQQRALYASESRRASMEVVDAITAAIPVTPARSFFERPEPPEPTPMTYDSETGEVYGHPALWGTCHRGFIGGAFEQCVTPPRSATEYAQFHLGHIITKEGDRVPIGKITFDTDHAPLTADVVAASRHYDNTGSVGAYVRARNGDLGPWFSGVLRPDLPEPALVSLRANPLSGDWRSLNGNLELVAALAVPVPGFPIPQLALSAALEGGVQSLILPGYCECAMPRSEYEQERDRLIAAVAR